MKILVVEDDPKISEYILKGLKEAQYLVESVSSGQEALDCLFTGQNYDLIILDIMIPGPNGLEVLKTLRDKGIHTPVLILSAKRSVEERVEGLTGGADDYLTKPFAFSELLARVQVLLRRTSAPTQSTSLSRFGIEVDLVKRSVKREGVFIELQPKEFALLEYLLKNAERVVSKTLILENVYGYNFDTQTNIVDVLVFRLRNKLDKDFPVKLLHTVRGVGYVLKEY